MVVNRLFLLGIVSLSSVLAFTSYAESMASYPNDWREWPVMKRDKIYSADVVVPEDAPLFLQDTVYAYNWLNNGEGSALTIRVNPKKLEEYKTHGPYSDGITVVAIAEDANTVWVTEHIAGFPVYGSYDTSGQDISDTHPSLNPDFCHACHYTYKDICVNGTCYAPPAGGSN